MPHVHPLQHSVTLLGHMSPVSPPWSPSPWASASPPPWTQASFEPSLSVSSDPISSEPKSGESCKIDALHQEIFEILALHYGFTPPLSPPSLTPLLTDKAEGKKLACLLGLSWSRCQSYIGKVPSASLAKSYLEAMLAGYRPKDDTCNFNTQSC